MFSSLLVSHHIERNSHVDSSQSHNGRVDLRDRILGVFQIPSRYEDRMLFERKGQTPTGPPKFHHHPRPATSSSPYHLSHTSLLLSPSDHIPAEPRKPVHRLIGVLVESLMMSHRFGHVGGDEGVCTVDLRYSLNAC
jgi:hypothetical protein